jgi:hypothetical protein
VCKVEENTPFRKYANAAWAERGAGGLRAGTGAGLGYATLGKALKICTSKFRRNFDMRIFPKFF